MTYRRQRALRNLAILLFTLAGTVLPPGCSQEPTEANALLAPLPLTDVAVRDTTIGATGSGQFIRRYPMDGAQDLIGTTAGYTAYSLIQFYPSYFPVRDTALVYSAKLRLHSLSWFGADSTGQFGFNVYLIAQSWNSLTATWDTVQKAGFYDAASVRGSYTGSGTGAIVVNLDTTMVRQWLATSTDTTTTKYGIILAPAAGSTVVWGYQQFNGDSSVCPTLWIIAGSPTGPERDTAAYYQGMDSFVSTVAGLPSDPALLSLQAGLVARSVLTFNVSFLPQGAVVNNAQLLLHQSPGVSRFASFPPDTTVQAHVLLSTTDTTVFEGTFATGLRLADTSNTYAIDIRHAVQAWIRGPNDGLLLRESSALEFSTFNLHALYNQLAADPGLRPRLRIIYSVPRK